ncbi:plastocyanin/azurin family copper-binding protein [Haloarchaeobius sp. HME9146]|uniref:plastocyanin/azurin family copper-binding protein n=1 Tax=Haloarchaeobius sp. HME9146 TaxID=2978732 RepID=UPI0021C16E47|nr:plastocyanin/azurin family copper-binding protein [Haloarchaeobius sp. HME9146]MCT9096562.1 plastocyanin/azurin family copper-binding protein [Haloarchaeobius sp. HME9146]
MTGMHASRRGLLRAGVASLPIALAGCLGGGDDGGGGTATMEPGTVAVGPDGNFVFVPEEITVSTGDTITWEWGSDNHNIVVESQPDEADWPGTEGGETKVYDDGYTYEYTFEVPGTYEYYCSPHRNVGMVGTVVVEE